MINLHKKIASFYTLYYKIFSTSTYFAIFFVLTLYIRLKILSSRFIIFTLHNIECPFVRNSSFNSQNSPISFLLTFVKAKIDLRKVFFVLYKLVTFIKSQAYIEQILQLYDTMFIKCLITKLINK